MSKGLTENEITDFAYIKVLTYNTQSVLINNGNLCIQKLSIVDRYSKQIILFLCKSIRGFDSRDHIKMVSPRIKLLEAINLTLLRHVLAQSNFS